MASSPNPATKLAHVRPVRPLHDPGNEKATTSLEVGHSRPAFARAIHRFSIATTVAVPLFPRCRVSAATPFDIGSN